MTLTKNHAELAAEVQAHIAADAVSKHVYWHEGKGCFIGCLTHSNAAYPAVERFGLTLPILRIAENIFDGMPLAAGREFFAAFPAAVERDGKDLSRVHWLFLAEDLSAMPAQIPQVQGTIDAVISGLRKLASGGGWPGRAVEASSRIAFVRTPQTSEAARAANSAVNHAMHAVAYDERLRKFGQEDDEDNVADMCANVARAVSKCALLSVDQDAFADADWPCAALARAANDAREAARHRQSETLLRLIKEAS